MTDEVVVRLTEALYRELLAIVLHYSTGPARWAVSRELRETLAEAGQAALR